jgi:hypothetical protein
VSELLDIHTVALLLRLGLVAWLGALVLIVVFRLMTGGIVLDGLLSHDPTGQQGFAERLTLLLATLGYALYYTSTALGTPLDAAEPALPDVPEGVLTVLLGVNGLYLTGKIIELRTKGS